MRILCILIVMVVALPALAGWSTNWPAWQYPRDLRIQVQDCYSGLLERTQCPNAGYDPEAPVFYRTFRSDVQALKDCLQNTLRARLVGDHPHATVFWVNTNLASSGSFDDYFNGGLELLTPMPKLTIEDIAGLARLPTNLLSYTPYRSELAGLGGFTNDLAIIGHAHGYTNAQTAAGGTNYPSGRSTWYTTDYGVDALRAAIACLAWRGSELPYSVWQDDNDNYLPSYTWYGSANWPYTANWSAMTNRWAATWHLITDFTLSTWSEASYSTWWNVFDGSVKATEFYWNASAAPQASTCDIYASASGYGFADGFYDYGSGLRENVYTRLASFSVAAGASATSPALGSSTNAPPEPWCEEVGPANETSGLGWTLNGRFEVRKYSFAYQ